MTFSRPNLQFIVSLAVALVTSVVLHTNRPPIPDPELRRDWFWAMKTHETEGLSLLVYGDSRVSQAVNTEPLAAKMPGARARNLGYAGAGFNPEIYGHLLRILGKDPKGKVVLLGITPYGLSTEANANKMFLQEWRRPASEVKERLELYPLLETFEPLRPSMFRDAGSKHGMYIVYHPDGWEEAYELPEDPGKWLPVYKRHFRRTQVDSENIEATYTFVQTCIRNGVRVFGFRPPTTREMEALENERSGFDEVSFVQGFEAAGGIWLSVADRFAYYSYDGCHLHRHAAKQFSRDLAAEFAKFHSP